MVTMRHTTMSIFNHSGRLRSRETMLLPFVLLLFLLVNPCSCGSPINEEEKDVAILLSVENENAVSLTHSLFSLREEIANYKHCKLLHFHFSFYIS